MSAAASMFSPEKAWLGFLLLQSPGADSQSVFLPPVLQNRMHYLMDNMAHGLVQHKFPVGSVKPHWPQNRDQHCQ